MLDGSYWILGLCDVCLKDESSLQPRLAGLMENGRWIGEYTKEKAKQVNKIYAQWQEEIKTHCIYLIADMESITICEKHLKEILARKKEEVGE